MKRTIIATVIGVVVGEAICDLTRYLISLKQTKDLEKRLAEAGEAFKEGLQEGLEDVEKVDPEKEFGYKFENRAEDGSVLSEMKNDYANIIDLNQYDTGKKSYSDNMFQTIIEHEEENDVPLYADAAPFYTTVVYLHLWKDDVVTNDDKIELFEYADWIGEAWKEELNASANNYIEVFSDELQAKFVIRREETTYEEEVENSDDWE